MVQDSFPDVLYSFIACMEISFHFALRAFSCHEKRWGLDVIKVLQKKQGFHDGSTLQASRIPVSFSDNGVRFHNSQPSARSHAAYFPFKL